MPPEGYYERQKRNGMLALAEAILMQTFEEFAEWNLRSDKFSFVQIDDGNREHFYYIDKSSKEINSITINLN